MKKFSKISNVKVNEAPKGEVESNTKDGSIKYSILQLIEDFLNIEIYGPIDPILEGTIKIEGKEVFIEALMELLKREDIKEQVLLLESAKYNGIDNVLNSLNDKVNENQTPSERTKHIKRIKDLIERSDYDIDKAIEKAKTQANRIKTPEKAYYRSVAAENLIGHKGMDKKTLTELSKIFLFRAQELGYSL